MVKSPKFLIRIVYVLFALIFVYRQFKTVRIDNNIPQFKPNLLALLPVHWEEYFSFLKGYWAWSWFISICDHMCWATVSLLLYFVNQSFLLLYIRFKDILSLMDEKAPKWPILDPDKEYPIIGYHNGYLSRIHSWWQSSLS